MKKFLLTTALLSGMVLSGSAMAGTFSFGNVNINVPDATSTSATQNTTNTNSANAKQITEQINALNSKINSVSESYKNTVNDLVKNLATPEQLTAYQEKVKQLNATAQSKSAINIDIAEDGSITINNALKNINFEDLKNLTSTQKSAIKSDLSSLNATSSQYSAIAKDATALINLIKKDPCTALSKASELISLGQNANDALKQVKNISELSATIMNAFAKAGTPLK